jgi:sugar O-acyltransferase (sialic acid O-acetyltransferase NeuD family)
MVKKKAVEKTTGLESRVVIIGYNRLAESVIDMLEMMETHHILGIIAMEENTNSFITTHKIYNGLKHLLGLTNKERIQYVVICLEGSKQRKDVSEYIQQSYPELKFFNVIHPSAILGKNVILGKGNIIGARTVINSDSQLGDFCLIKDQVSIGHESRIKNFVMIKTHTTIGGQVQINNQSVIGSRSNVINNVLIGEHCLIKENTLILKDVPDGAIL